MLYIFCGDDYASINKRYRSLVAAQKLKVCQCESVAEASKYLYQQALFNDNTVYCVRYDKDFLTAESAWSDIAINCDKKNLILFYGELDKRSKFYKFFLKFIIDFRLDESSPVFKVSEFICRKQLHSAIKLAQTLENDDIMFAFNSVYNKLRKILQIQTTPKGVRVSVNTGLSEQEQYMQRSFLNIYTEEQLSNMLDTINNIIESIKSGGTPLDISLKYLIYKIQFDILC